MITARGKLRQAKRMAQMSGKVQANIDMAREEEAFVEAVDAEVDALAALFGVGLGLSRIAEENE